jgi:hypothetical protein
MLSQSTLAQKKNGEKREKGGFEISRRNSLFSVNILLFYSQCKTTERVFENNLTIFLRSYLNSTGHISYSKQALNVVIRCLIRRYDVRSS